MARAKKEAALTPEERLQAALVPDWEWPYKLPENWCWTTIKNVATVVTGGTPAKNNSDYYGGEFPFFKPADLDAGRHVSEASEYLSDLGKSVSRIIPAQATAVCCIGSIGKCGFLDVEGATNQQINSAIPYFNARYQYFYMNTEFFTNQLRNSASATTIAIVNKTKMESCYYPLAPLAEQQRIVDRIESLFAKLDEAKEKAQAVVDSFETRKAAILHKAFTGELTAKWREEHGSSIGHWKECSIGDVFTHTTGKALKRNNQNGILKKYITTSNLYWGTFDFSEVREMYFTNEELEKCTAKKGDLLVCNGGDVGRAAIWNYDYDICLQNHISKLRRKTDSISVPFFYYYFMFLKINGNIAGRGIGIASLSAKDLLAIKVYLPSMTEQQQISHILDELFDKEQQTKEAAEAVLDRIDLMKKSILARAFRGELGTNDPSEESAVELLKQVWNTASEQRKTTVKRAVIPKSLENRIKTDLERKIIKLYFQNKVDVLTIDLIMSVSSKKFDIMEALRDLQQRGILEKENNKYKLLG